MSPQRLRVLFGCLALALGTAVSAPKATAIDSVLAAQAAPNYKNLEAAAKYTFSGLRFVMVRPGQGPQPKAGMKLKVHYTGWLTDGTKFDSSRDRGQPFEFVLGAHQVIAGWDEGLADMRKGERRYLLVPPELGYGQQPSGPIPVGSTLIFDVELVDF